MIVFPNAKINIGLDILEKRTDGYHNIETLFYPISWRDVLEIVPARGNESTLTVTGRPIICPPEKNLVMKAYRALCDVAPLPDVDIYLHKIIPDGAGLGGGSSDASHTLKALNEMFGLGISDTELANIAASIGADCPFFIYNQPMLASETGTTLTPCDLSLKGASILIVKPPVSVPTAQAYSGVTPMHPEQKLTSALSRPRMEWMGTIKNDFEKSIFQSYKVIADIKRKIVEMGAFYASMSGSGSAVYGLFDGDILSYQFKNAFKECDIFTGELD